MLHRPLDGTPTTVTLSRTRTGTWFAAFSCAIDPQPLHPTSAVVGVDVGRESCATVAHGEQVANPRFYRRDAADLKRVQRRKDAAKNGQDWQENAKQTAILAKIHEWIANRRADWAHQQSRALVDRFHGIVFAQLAPKKMGKNRGMRKRIRDVAWSPFTRMTVSKAAQAGRRVILVDARTTSKRCSRCGELIAKTVSERTHSCRSCGLVMERDRNAAITIVQRGFQTLQT